MAEEVPDDRSVYSDADDSEDEAFEETSQVAPDVMLHAEEVRQAFDDSTMEHVSAFLCSWV